MRICICSFGEPLPIDGATTRLRRMSFLTQIATSRGSTVEWIAPSFNHITKKHRVSHLSHFHDGSLTVTLYKSISYKKNLSIRRFLSLFDDDRKILGVLKKGEDFDLIIFPMEYAPFLSRTIAYCKKHHKKIVMDLRDKWDMVYDAIPKGLHWLIWPYKGFVEHKLKKYVPLADGTIALSEPMQKWFLRYAGRKLDQTRDQVYPLGFFCPPLNETSSSSSFWQARGITCGDFLVVYAGGLGNFVDIKDIVEASRDPRLPRNAKFVVCGTGKEFSRLKELENNRLIVPGQVGFQDLVELYRISSLGIMPYKKDAFFFHAPNKFAEYLCFGLPILLKPEGYMKELILSYNCGFPYDDSDGLIAAICNAISNKPTDNPLARNAKYLFNECFDGARVYESYYRFLLKIWRRDDD